MAKANNDNVTDDKTNGIRSTVTSQMEYQLQPITSVKNICPQVHLQEY